MEYVQKVRNRARNWKQNGSNAEGATRNTITESDLAEAAQVWSYESLQSPRLSLLLNLMTTN